MIQSWVSNSFLVTEAERRPKYLKRFLLRFYFLKRPLGQMATSTLICGFSLPNKFKHSNQSTLSKRIKISSNRTILTSYDLITLLSLALIPLCFGIPVNYEGSPIFPSGKKLIFMLFSRSKINCLTMIWYKLTFLRPIWYFLFRPNRRNVILC